MPDQETLSRTEVRARLEKQLQEAALGGDTKTLHYRCEHCGRAGSLQTEVFDPDLQLKLLKTLEDMERADKNSGAIGDKAEKVLGRVRDLTDDELAAEIVRLRGT